MPPNQYFIKTSCEADAKIVDVFKSLLTACRKLRTSSKYTTGYVVMDSRHGIVLSVRGGKLECVDAQKYNAKVIKAKEEEVSKAQ